MGEIELEGVREYAEGLAVTLRETDADGAEGRLVVVGANESGYNCVEIDLLDLIAWLMENRPDIIGSGSGECSRSATT